MEILEIPKETQALICGLEELFSADLIMHSKQTDVNRVVRNCVFFRKEVYPGLERLSYVEGVEPCSLNTVFGYYDRANNRLNYYQPGMEMKGKEFSFHLGVAGAKDDWEVNNFAIELIDSFLFTPDGELNQEELEQLAIDFSGVESNKNTILWFAQKLFPHPEKSFRELLLTDISQTLLKNTPIPFPKTQIVIPFDTIAIVKFLEGTEEGELFMRRAARDLVCKFDGVVSKGLLSAWESFLAAQKGIRERTEEQLKTTRELIRSVQDALSQHTPGNIAVVRNDGEKDYFDAPMLLDQISPLGIHAGLGGKSYFWEDIKMIKNGRSIIWRR